MTIYLTVDAALRAAPVGHYVMFREKGRGAEFRIMSPDQRSNSHVKDWDSWQTWCRKEAGKEVQH